MDATHSSRVFGWIEQPNVALMHAQAGEPTVGGALPEHGAGVGIPFNSGNWLVPEDEIGKQPSATAGKEVKRSHVISGQNQRKA